MAWKHGEIFCHKHRSLECCLGLKSAKILDSSFVSEKTKQKHSISRQHDKPLKHHLTFVKCWEYFSNTKLTTPGSQSRVFSNSKLLTGGWERCEVCEVKWGVWGVTVLTALWTGRSPRHQAGTLWRPVQSLHSTHRQTVSSTFSDCLCITLCTSTSTSTSTIFVFYQPLCVWSTPHICKF